MAMSASGLADEMVSELKSQGFDVENPHAKTKEMCDALAKAVVSHLKANAQAVVAGGSSSGNHPIT